MNWSTRNGRAEFARTGARQRVPLLAMRRRTPPLGVKAMVGDVSASDLAVRTGDPTHCVQLRADGRPCGGYAVAGSECCFAHAPEQADKRSEARRRGGLAGRVATVPESQLTVRSLGDVLALVELTINDVRV